MTILSGTTPLLTTRSTEIQNAAIRKGYLDRGTAAELFEIEWLLGGGGGGGSSVSALATFTATANGAGYSTDDIIVALSDGTWRNITTGATIAAPPNSDLGSLTVDGELLLWVANADNAGIGYSNGDYLYQIVNTSTGGSSWYRNGIGISAPPAGEVDPVPSGGTTSTSSPTPTPFRVDSGPIQYGVLSTDGTQISSLPLPGTTYAIGSGSGEAEVVSNSSELELTSTITLNSPNEVSAPVSIAAGLTLLTVKTAVKVTAYSSPSNAPISIIPEVSFFDTTASDEFARIEQGLVGPINSITTGHMISTPGALRGATAFRVRREDAAGDISAAVTVKLIWTVK